KTDDQHQDLERREGSAEHGVARGGEELAREESQGEERSSDHERAQASEDCNTRRARRIAGDAVAPGPHLGAQYDGDGRARHFLGESNRSISSVDSGPAVRRRKRSSSVAWAAPAWARSSSIVPVAT